MKKTPKLLRMYVPPKPRKGKKSKHGVHPYRVTVKTEMVHESIVAAEGPEQAARLCIAHSLTAEPQSRTQFVQIIPYPLLSK